MAERNGLRVSVLLAAAVVLGVAALYALSAPSATLSTFSTRFLGIFIEAVPFLLLGAVASGLIAAFVTPAHIARWTPRNPVAAGFTGSMLGFIFPVCECGVVPVVRRLLGKGMPISMGIAFLLAAPVMNFVVLLSTYAAFGWGVVLAGRFLITAAVAMSVGWVFAAQAKPADLMRPRQLAPITGGAVEAVVLPGRVTVGGGVRQGLSLAVDEFFLMGRFLVIGCLLAAGMQTFVSQDTLISLGQGPVVSVIIMQALAFVLSICSTVDAFLALAFAGTFTTGAILAFLTFGPMVDIKSAIMYLGVFRVRTVVYLILLPLLMTMLIGVTLNLNAGA